MPGPLSRHQQALVRATMDVVATEMFRLRSPAHLREELRSCAYESLVQSALRFDPSRCVPFRAFARQRMRWAMTDYLRRCLPHERRRARLERALQAYKTDPQLAQDAERSRAWILRTKARLRALSKPHPSAKTPDQLPTDPDRDWMLRLQQADQEQRYGRMVRHMLGTLSASEREFLRAIYSEDLSLSDYARTRGLSPSAVSRRHSKLLQKMRELTLA